MTTATKSDFWREKHQAGTVQAIAEALANLKYARGVQCKECGDELELCEIIPQEPDHEQMCSQCVFMLYKI